MITLFWTCYNGVILSSFSTFELCLSVLLLQCTMKRWDSILTINIHRFSSFQCIAFNSIFFMNYYRYYRVSLSMNCCNIASFDPNLSQYLCSNQLFCPVTKEGRMRQIRSNTCFYSFIYCFLFFCAVSNGLIAVSVSSLV